MRCMCRQASFFSGRLTESRARDWAWKQVHVYWSQVRLYHGDLRDRSCLRVALVTGWLARADVLHARDGHSPSSPDLLLSYFYISPHFCLHNVLIPLFLVCVLGPATSLLHIFSSYIYDFVKSVFIFPFFFYLFLFYSCLSSFSSGILMWSLYNHCYYYFPNYGRYYVVIFLLPFFIMFS